MDTRFIILLGSVLLLLVACSTGQETQPVQPVPIPAPAPPALPAPEEPAEEPVSVVTAQDEPFVETLDNLRQVQCGDGFCSNREHLSENKAFTCGMRTDFCNIHAGGRQIATENYYLCPEDCASTCDIDFRIDICERRDGVYKLDLFDGKDNIEYLMHWYKGRKANFLAVILTTEGSVNWDTNTFNHVTGDLYEVSFMPKMKNEHGVMVDCLNGEVTFKAENIRAC